MNRAERDIKNAVNFLNQTEGLKVLLRHSWLSTGRRESVAEHSWRLAVMVMIFHDKLKYKINLERALQMALIHDLGEVYAGDHFAWRGTLKNKYQLERAGMVKITKNLPQKERKKFLELWEEHEQNRTKESKLVRALDKLEALIQHNEADIKSWNKKERVFNLSYGDIETTHDPFLKQLRTYIRTESKKKLKP